MILKQLVKNFLGRGYRKSYSQFGEDVVVFNLFRKKRQGTYLDIGCYHPMLYSNTYLLYREGWSGTVVDANPDLARAFTFFRPRDHFVRSGVGNPGELTYYRFKDEAYNGFVNQSVRSPLVSSEKVVVVPLKDLLKEPVDFLAVDTEGMDLDILKSHDWTIKPQVICVEADCDTFLREKGYEKVVTLGLSSIYQLSGK